MMTSPLIAHHRRQFEKYRAYWDEPDRAGPAGLSEELVAYSVLEHAARLAELTGDTEFVDELTDLPVHDLQELVRAACRYANPAAIKARAATVFDRDALSESDLEVFDAVLVSADVLRSVLDAAARLADALEEPDASIAVGDGLFALDELIDFLYARPDVISVRWRIAQRTDGSVPGWLARARAIDDRERPAQPIPSQHAEPDARAKRRLAVVRKLLDSATPKRIREFRTVALPPGRAGTSLLRLPGPRGRFKLELLSGLQPGSISIEFTSHDRTLANELFGYVLDPGPDGSEVAGFAVMVPAEEGVCVAEAVVPAGDVRRLAGACNGVTAGPVDPTLLSEDDWGIVLAAARADLTGPRASAWRSWAAAEAAADLPERVRAELRALTQPETA